MVVYKIVLKLYNEGIVKRVNVLKVTSYITSSNISSRLWCSNVILFVQYFVLKGRSTNILVSA